MPSACRRFTVATVSLMSEPGRKVTKTVVPSRRTLRKFSILAAPPGVTSSEQFSRNLIMFCVSDTANTCIVGQSESADSNSPGGLRHTLGTGPGGFRAGAFVPDLRPLAPLSQQACPEAAGSAPDEEQKQRQGAGAAKSR